MSVLKSLSEGEFTVHEDPIENMESRLLDLIYKAKFYNQHTEALETYEELMELFNHILNRDSENGM